MRVRSDEVQSPLHEKRNGLTQRIRRVFDLTILIFEFNRQKQARLCLFPGRVRKA